MPLVIRQKPRVFLVHQRRGDDEIGRSPIAGHRDIPNDGDAQERLDVGIMRHGLKRILFAAAFVAFIRYDVR